MYIYLLSLSSLLLQSRLSLAHAFVLKKKKKHSHSSCMHAFAFLLAKKKRISDCLLPHVILAFILAIPIAELVLTKKSRERKSPETLNE